MRILIILTPPFDPNAGGVQMSTFKMGSYFSSQGLEVAIFSFEKAGHITVDFAAIYAATESGNVENAGNLKQLGNVLTAFQPQVVINQMPYEHAIGDVLLQYKQRHSFLHLGCLRNTLFSVKLNLDIYVKNVVPKPIQSLFNNALGKGLLQQQHRRKHAKDLRRILDTNDYFVMFDKPNQMELEYFVGKYKAHKTAFIPNSIPKIAEEVPQKEKRILWLSRLSYGQKQAQLILPLWKKVKDALPDWELDIVGDGDAFADIKKQIEEEQTPRINLHGKQQPDTFYSRASIYVMTSAFEGFPNTVIEAQSFGAVPVIFDNYPMASAVINHATDGLLIPPFDLDEMSRSIIGLAKEKETMHAMAENALANARKYSINEVGKKWMALFDDHKKY